MTLFSALCAFKIVSVLIIISSGCNEFLYVDTELKTYYN
jgi:hypothetical protein